MGKSDQQNVQKSIDTEQSRQLKENQSGIDYTKQRQEGVYDPRSDTEHNSLWGAYSTIANDPNHGISDADRSRLLGVTGNAYNTPDPSRQPSYSLGGGQPVGAGNYQGNIPNNPLGGGGNNQQPQGQQAMLNGPSNLGSYGADGSPGGTFAGGGTGAGGQFTDTSGQNSGAGGSSSGSTTTPGSGPGYGTGYGASSQLPYYLNTPDDYLRPDDSSYRNTYSSMMGDTGGYDPARTARLNSAVGKLYDTSGNYGDVNNSVSSLQGAKNNYGTTNQATQGLLGIGQTGGVTGNDFNNINRDTLQEFEKTGGYTDPQKADIRARANSSLAANYGAMKDQLQRRQAVTGQVGPGLGANSNRLARQGAQDSATNARNTEVDLANAVRQGRSDAAGKLSDANLQLQGIKTTAALQGYGTAGNLDVDKNTSINNAMKAAGDLGLQRQSQIDSAMEAAAGIDVNTQDSINKARLGGASGLRDTDLGQMDVRSRDNLGRMGLASSDTLGRMSIGASSSNAAAAREQAGQLARMGLDAENQRFLIGQGQQGQFGSLSGLSNLYNTGQSTANQNAGLLENYRMGTGQGQNALINSQIQNNATNKTDWMGLLGMGLKGASLIPGLGGGPGINGGSGPATDDFSHVFDGYGVGPGGYGGSFGGPSNPNYE